MAAVWYPNVYPGWAPYREGHWAWVEPWGWTWVDDAPWGFAPFHYGRWVNVGGRWGWVPGPVAVASGVCSGAGGLGRRTGLRRVDWDSEAVEWAGLRWDGTIRLSPPTT